MKHNFYCALFILIVITVVSRQVVLLFGNTRFRPDHFLSGGVSGLISFYYILNGEELDQSQDIYGGVASVP